MDGTIGAAGGSFGDAATGPATIHDIGIPEAGDHR
jgi:hypothetical protein